MKLDWIKLSISAALVQSAVAAYLFYVEIEIPLISLLVFPIIFVIFLTRRLQHQLIQESDQHRLNAIGLNQELNSVRQSANRDPLTGLHSRSYTKERLEELLEISARRNQKCAVLFLDLDFFKEFNEALGHTLGNQLLMRVGKRLQSIVKKEDLLGYQGGDEFVIILSSINDVMAAELVARRVITEMGNQLELQGRMLSVSVSIGVAVSPLDGSDSETLLRRAESALKTSKAQGRKAYSFYSKDMNDSAAERMQIDQLMRGAMQRNEFYLVYQPIVSEKTKSLKGFEVLLRWRNDELGEVSPAKFIPIAEQIGLVTDIGNWVLRESIEQLKLWLSTYGRPIVMSINVSPRQFQDESILPMVKSILQNTGVKPSLIQLEVTEGLFLSASDRIIKSIDLLKKFGVRLALDDFGTGYSSLSYLNQLPFDVLKIDKKFVDDLATNENDRKMVSAIISIARGLKMETVVEGVETPQQVHLIRQMGADAVQGYYYSKPLPAREAESRFLTRPEITEINESIWDKL